MQKECLQGKFIFHQTRLNKYMYVTDFWGNQVLITSTVQVELWKLNFNFDDIRTNFLQILT